MERLPLDWFLDIPVVTRMWITSIVANAVLVQCGCVNRVQMLYNFKKVFEDHEYWRIFTTFTYYGQLDANLLFFIYYIAQYSRLLEESSYEGRTGEYLWILAVAGSALLTVSSFTSNLPILGPFLAEAVIYIWARRNPDVRLGFLGLFSYSAAYLPWMLALMSILSRGNPVGQFAGIAIGHVLFFFEDIYPSVHGGDRPLAPPWQRQFVRHEPVVEANQAHQRE
jgi:Derlin-2/3